MAQSTLKSKKLTTATAKSSTRRSTVLGPKKGQRTIAPKKNVLVRNQGMIKVRFCFSVFVFEGRIRIGSVVSAIAVCCIRGVKKDVRRLLKDYGISLALQRLFYSFFDYKRVFTNS